jgi:hypothetical protein
VHLSYPDHFRHKRVAVKIAGPLLVVLLAACGGTSSPLTVPSAAATHQGQPPASQPPASQPSATPAAARFGGIILANISLTGPVTLDAIDPATGDVTATRTFPSGQASLAVNALDYPPVWRSDFNSSFTEAAATGPQASDGSQSAGYVDTAGTYTARTAGSTGYSSIVDKLAIGFAPDGDLWYVVQGPDGANFGHVNPAIGPSSDQPYSGTTPYASDAYGTERAYVTSDGVPDAVTAAITKVYLPSGTEVTQDTGGPGYLIGPWGTISGSTPDTPVKGGGDEWIVAPVNAHQFLTENNSKTQLWLNTIEHGVVQTTPLLPMTNRIFNSAVVSPDGQTVAILGSDGTLWTVPISGGQPRQVTGFNATVTQFGGLMTWT